MFGHLDGTVKYWDKTPVRNWEGAVKYLSIQLKYNLSDDAKARAQNWFFCKILTVLFIFLFVFFIIFPKKWSRYYNSHILDDISINHLILLGSEYILYSFFKLTSEALRRWLCLYDENRRWHAVNGSTKQRNEIWIKYWKWNSAYLVIHTVLQLLFRGP